MCGKLYITFILLSVVNIALAARATELIFRKTTTTTTELPIESTNSTETGNGQVETNEEGEEGPKTKLTGIPQIDYIHDPNLPHELKGYNLSSYPFLELVPPEEEIDFVCDGLHDGFYASVKFNCQLYHHCLFGIRYDFLCANFTAFDQKTFICHFASEVDCKNSPRYFYRNDALYKASTTTELQTRPPTTTTATTTTTTAKPPKAHKGQRPYRRRPVIYDDYYYDEYEEKPLRYRPRHPQIEDDYDFEDERVINRRPNRKRKYYGGRRKSYVQRPPLEYYEDYEEEEVPVAKVPNKKKVNSAVLQSRNKEEPEVTAPEKPQPPKPVENSKSSLFSQPRNPARLGIKIRRDPGSTTTQKPSTVKEYAKEFAPVEAEYSYEDYQDEVIENEKQLQEEEKVIAPKQTKISAFERKQILAQRKS